MSSHERRRHCRGPVWLRPTPATAQLDPPCTPVCRVAGTNAASKGFLTHILTSARLLDASPSPRRGEEVVRS